MSVRFLSFQLFKLMADLFKLFFNHCMSQAQFIWIPWFKVFRTDSFYVCSLWGDQIFRFGRKSSDFWTFFLMTFWRFDFWFFNFFQISFRFSDFQDFLDSSFFSIQSKLTVTHNYRYSVPSFLLSNHSIALVHKPTDKRFSAWVYWQLFLR